MIDGVCGGIAEYLDVDVSIVRIIFVVSLFTSIPFWVYIVLAIVIPRAPLGDGKYLDDDPQRRPRE